ncbi:MAG: hypothetical protein ACNYPH_00770 [Gammaproteobacteria bacterium WSBS_2016_MAG_OTU1]
MNMLSTINAGGEMSAMDKFKFIDLFAGTELDMWGKTCSAA